MSKYREDNATPVFKVVKGLFRIRMDPSFVISFQSPMLPFKDPACFRVKGKGLQKKSGTAYGCNSLPNLRSILRSGCH